jgi:uncharacterized protein (DUF2062 family)
MSNWLKTKVLDPLLNLLKQGTTPSKLGWSVAAGFAIGTSPLIGTSTILCVVVGFIFRLNHPAIQIAHLALSPLQFPFLFFFIYAGEKLFNQPHIVPIIIQEVKSGSFSPFATVETYWSSFWHAGLVWLLVAIPLVIILGLSLSAFFHRIKNSTEATP